MQTGETPQDQEKPGEAKAPMGEPIHSADRNGEPVIHGGADSANKQDVRSSQKSASQAVVWQQFRKRKMGLWSLYAILLLFALAIYAPFLANEKPLALWTTYGGFYDYAFAGWARIHDTLIEGLSHRKDLEAQARQALEGFEAEKKELRNLHDGLNTIGDRYDELRTRVNSLQGELDQLFAEKEELRKNGTDNASIQSRIDELTKEKKPLEAERKKMGAQKARQRKSIESHRQAQEAHNRVLARCRFRLDFQKMHRFLLRNLQTMQLFVDESTGARLEEVRRHYTSELKPLYGGSAPKKIQALAAKIQDTMHSELSPTAIRKHLVYRWTFPALSELGLGERLFMIGYALLGLLILFWKRLGSIQAFDRVVGTLALSLLLAWLSGLLSLGFPDASYKRMLVKNIQSGWTESVAYFPPVPFGYNENNLEEHYQPPAFVSVEGRHGRHPLGTDNNGRDVMSRMIWGARVSLSVSFVAVSIYLAIGIFFGALAGYFGGWVDMAISRFIEIVICFPSFFLILAVIAFLQPSMYNVMIVIGLTSWTGVARLTRGEFLKLRGQEFAVAAKSLGAGNLRIMFRHILPNALTPVMVSAAFGFAGTILVESGLSFLGFGVQEPNPSWGQMINSSRGSPLLYWWLFLVPGLALFVTVTLYNLVGNSFRDAADPRLRQ